MRRSLPIASALAVLAACDPFVFDDLEDEAPVRVLEAPAGFPGRDFPAVLSGYEGTIGGERVSRLAASGGPDAPFVVYRAWQGSGLALGAPLFDGCDDAGECDPGAGAAIAGIPVWRAGSPDEGRMCVVIGAPTEGSVMVRCESGGGAGSFEVFMGPASVDFGASAASLGPDNPIGVAILGAPQADRGRGGVYRIPDGAGPVALAVPDEARVAGGQLGASLAAAQLADGSTVIAAGAPDARRVVVLVVTDAGGSAVDVSLRACLDGTGTEYGRSLAWGDVNGDGTPDLAVGPSGAGVDVFDGADLPDPGGCGDWGSAPMTIACPEAVRDGLVGCAGSAFGASLATGDVNADGVDDLLVGAPDAEVGGVGGAGAVFLFPGGAGGPDTGGADALTLTSPEEGDELGRALTTIASHLNATRRVEPAASVRGRSSVAVFLCSGLDGDTPDVGKRCTER